MIGGLRGATSRYALAVAVGAVMAVAFVGKPALAADLGGDCCADLEERVAELEATTVRKGNKKVTVEVYGRMNRVVNFWDDSVEKNVYVENNSYSSSRFGFKGKAKIGGDWSAGYHFEIEDLTALSKEVDQVDDDAAFGGLNVRRSAMYLDSKKYGRLWWGLWSTAKDDITKDNLVVKGLDQSMHQDFYMNWDMFLRPKGFDTELGPGAAVPGATPIRYRDIARCYSTSSSSFDCSTRRNLVRYDTPDWNGFVASWAWGEDDIWSAALRYNAEWGKNWKVGAGIAYEDFSDERVNAGGGGLAGFARDIKEYAGSASIIHTPTGIFLWSAFSNSENDDSNAFGVFTGTRAPEKTAWDISGGLHRDFFAPGKTTIWGGYTKAEDGLGFNATRSVAPGRIPTVLIPTEMTGSELTKWYIGFDQAIDSAAMNLFIAYQHIQPDVDLVDSTLTNVPVPLDDFDVIFAGGRIQF